MNLLQISLSQFLNYFVLCATEISLIASVYRDISARGVIRTKMFLNKKDCVVAVLVLYAFLLFMYFMVHDSQNIEKPCRWHEPCVRFCCIDRSSCKDSFIRDHFDSSLLKRFYYDDDNNDTVNYVILHGRPRCSLESVTVNWQFSYVRFDENKQNSRLKFVISHRMATFQLTTCSMGLLITSRISTAYKKSRRKTKKLSGSCWFAARFYSPTG